MPLYWSLKKVPELGQRSAKERRQAVWQVGLKPFRHWQVWVAMLVTSLAILLGMEILLDNLLGNPATAISDSGLVLLAGGLAAIASLAQLIYTHFYLKAMRPYLRQVSFDRAGSGWGAWIKSVAINVIPAVLLLGGVVGLDWLINSFDERPDPRIAAINGWPAPIPASGNGFFAAVGLQAAPDTEPFAAGQAWVAAVSNAALEQAKEPATAPNALKYTAYAGKHSPDAQTKATGANAYAPFCTPGAEPCWKVVREERREVEAWLAANQELLARYLALQQYPKWQFAISGGNAYTPLPPYSALLRAQGLLQATALLDFEKKQPGRALDLIARDMRFARNLLASKDVLIGKMVAATLLARDTALLAETMEAHPGDIRLYRAEIAKMVEALDPAQLSLADALRFEQRTLAFIAGQGSFTSFGTSLPALGAAWAEHHYKRNATANRMVEYYDDLIGRLEARGADYSPVTVSRAAAFAPKLSHWTGFMHNQEGNAILLAGIPDYREYLNRLYDLNALNSLVRLRLALAAKGAAAKDVSALLAAGDNSLWNPETGRPFEWDAERKQIFYTPASDMFKNRYSLGCGVAGRSGLAVL